MPAVPEKSSQILRCAQADEGRLAAKFLPVFREHFWVIFPAIPTSFPETPTCFPSQQEGEDEGTTAEDSGRVSFIKGKIVEIQGDIIEETRAAVQISGLVRFPSGQTIEDEGKIPAESSASSGQAGCTERRRRVHSRIAAAVNPPYSIHSHQACSACSL